MASNHAELRETLKTLESYELPERLQAPAGSSALLDDAVIERYQTARDEYLRRRIQQVFYEHLTTFEQGDSKSFEFPPLPTKEEEQELEQKGKELQERLKQTALDVNRQYQLLQTKYESFCDRRQELSRMVQDLEDSAFDAGSHDTDMELEGDVVAEEDMAREEERLAELRQRRAQLEAELNRIRSETARSEQNLQESNATLMDLRQARDAPRAVSPETVEETKAETAMLKEKVTELKEMSEWYDSLRGVTEELSGIKIVGVENAPVESEAVVTMKVQLLGKHVVQVDLKADEHCKRGDTLRVCNAKFLTSTQVISAAPDGSESITMNIPQPDDLVRFCALGPIEDLRFVLRETMFRIRTIVARADELAALRTKYLTKVGKHAHDQHSHGGEDQEIVCSLNEGVSVVLRLSPDCPIATDSVKVDQIVGVGGWEPKVIEALQTSINSRLWRGPLSLMDALADEIERMQKEDGVTLPRTPSMPSRNK